MELKFFFRRTSGFIREELVEVGEQDSNQVTAEFQRYKDICKKIEELQIQLEEAKDSLFLVSQEDCKEHLHVNVHSIPESNEGYGADFCIRCGKTILI